MTEPREGTILRDCDGDAWQRHGDVWYCTQPMFGPIPSAEFDHLYDIGEPLTVLYDPEAKP